MSTIDDQNCWEEFTGDDAQTTRVKNANLGIEYYEAGQFEKAIPLLQKAACEWADVEHPVMLAEAFAKSGRYLEAIAASFIALSKPKAQLFHSTKLKLYRSLLNYLYADQSTAAAQVCVDLVAMLEDTDLNSPHPSSDRIKIETLESDLLKTVFRIDHPHSVLEPNL